MYNLDDNVSKIQGIGPKYQTLLEKLNIKTIEDLISHYPFRYENKANKKNIADIIEPELLQIRGEIIDIQNIFTRNRKKITKGKIKDNTGTLEMIWFNQHYIKKQLPVGAIVSLYGKIEFNGKKPMLISPEILRTDETESKFLPVYPTTEGITSSWLKKQISNVLVQIEIPEYFDIDNLHKFGINKRKDSINELHKPTDEKYLSIAKKTLSFEELLFLHLKGLSIKAKWTQSKISHKFTIDENLINIFIKNLPFELTNAQNIVIGDIIDDLKSTVPMNRLLQGDVGSGKTIVAVIALLSCIQNKQNAIFIAPTQILAEQHYINLKKYIGETANIVLETNTSANVMDDSDKPLIIVGTHAILHRLDKINTTALIIIDEQHKFGVKQRSLLIDHFTEELMEENGKSTTLMPNLLTMTATPIPRSLALTFYNDLDLSTIDEMPRERKVVKTHVIKESQRKSTYKWINSQIDENGTQVFWVCPFIEQSENESLKNVKAAELELINLKKEFPNKKIEILHGRMKSEEKNKILNDFKNNKFQILVTTPVIEVGIDIPNANIIFIETAERFGLASLHQLRGRVGRSNNQGYCIVITGNQDGNYERLHYLKDIYDGNKLAEIDLKLRGSGDIYGLQQHGSLSLKIADFMDFELIKQTKKVAIEILANLNKYKAIKEKLAVITNIQNN